MQPNEWLRWICDAKNTEDLAQKYNQWADHYDEQVGQAWSSVPVAAAYLLAKYRDDKPSLIMDVGAGTGLAGVALASLGFQRLIAVDLSQDMLNQAKQKNIYESLVCCAIDEPQFASLPMVSGMIATGVLAENHAGANELRQLQKKITVGGVVVFTARQSFLPKLELILNQPEWRLLSSKILPVYDDPIQLFAYQILADAV